jgi:hypothetical protein
VEKGIMMKKRKQTIRWLVACLLVGSVIGGRADILMKLQMEHAQLMRYESVNAFVSIFNDSFEDLTLGKPGEGGRLTFRAEVAQDEWARRINQKPLVSPPIVIPPGQGRDIIVNVGDFYDLSQLGGYAIRVALDWKGDTYLSNLLRVDVVFGLPILDEKRMFSNGGHFARRFQLRYLARERTEHLFLSVGDLKGVVQYGTFDLGQVIRLNKPVLDAKRDGTVKVMQQSGLDRYTLSTLKVYPEWVEFLDQTYHREDGSVYEEESEKSALKKTLEKDAEASPKKRPWWQVFKRSKKP